MIFTGNCKPWDYNRQIPDRTIFYLKIFLRQGLILWCWTWYLKSCHSRASLYGSFQLWFQHLGGWCGGIITSSRTSLGYRLSTEISFSYIVYLKLAWDAWDTIIQRKHTHTDRRHHLPKQANTHRDRNRQTDRQECDSTTEFAQLALPNTVV